MMTTYDHVLVDVDFPSEEHRRITGSGVICAYYMKTSSEQDLLRSWNNIGCVPYPNIGRFSSDCIAFLRLAVKNVHV